MSDRPGLTPLGKFFVYLFGLLCIAAAIYKFGARFGITLPNLSGGGPSGAAFTRPFSGQGHVKIGVAYGTEKKRWLEWAVAEFAKSSDGSDVTVDLIPMGSLDAAHALVNGDQRIQVWSPASALYKESFVQDWIVKYGGKSPILSEERLALSPMVFVFWDERYQEFAKKYGKMTFSAIADAEQQKGGWDSIAGKPEWGFFKFGHTRPSESNSGLLTLVLAAYSYSNKTRNLTLEDIVNVGFQEWLAKLERGVADMSDSTGNMMREMVLKGPSSYDGLFVYESVAIDYLKNAEGRWGALRVVYPDYNAWNDNPYYIIDATWSSADQRRAALAFQQFLLSEPIQKESVLHGFRPANPSVPVKFAGSPFSDYASYGIQDTLGKMCDPPKAEVLNNLLTSWQRTQTGR